MNEWSPFSFAVEFETVSHLRGRGGVGEGFPLVCYIYHNFLYVHLSILLSLHNLPSD